MDANHRPALRRFNARRVVYRPQLERSVESIPPVAGALFAECVAGTKPWPMFLHGDVGTGKTRFSLVIHDYFGGYWCDFADLAAEYVCMRRNELPCAAAPFVPASYERPVRESEWFDAIERLRLLIIDDVGRRSESKSDTSRELLTRVMDRRENLPLLLTSNLDPEAIGKLYDDRVASRCCAGTVVGITGKDRRLEKQK